MEKLKVFSGGWGQLEIEKEFNKWISDSVTIKDRLMQTHDNYITLMIFYEDAKMTKEHSSGCCAKKNFDSEGGC